MQNKRKATDFFGSLRWRMVGIYLLVTVLVLVAISSLVSSLMEEFLVSQRTQDQLQETARLALEVAPYMSGADVDEPVHIYRRQGLFHGGRVLVLDSDAVVQMDSASRENGFLLPYREVRRCFGKARIPLTASTISFGAEMKGFSPKATRVSGQCTTRCR